MLIRTVITFTFFLCFCCCSEAPKEDQKNIRSDEEINTEKTIPEDTQYESYEKFILFFGNSLSAGYGLKEGESFPDRIQERLDSLGYRYKVVNAGVSGETTADGAGRINWVLGQDIDIFVLELGGNDILRGLDINYTEKNLRTIIESVRTKDPEIKIILAGMQSPPNMGEAYSKALADLYPRLANEYDVGLIPFLLDIVGGNPEFNQPDAIHPNVEGAKIVANTVWKTLVSYLEKEN
ncbi:MAG: arylesterase [Bacteroidia bacterium]|nr:arylesterase [Bacteroidia bacterium]